MCTNNRYRSNDYFWRNVCVWMGDGGGEGGSASTIATDICLTEDWNNNIMCASTAASN